MAIFLNKLNKAIEKFKSLNIRENYLNGEVIYKEKPIHQWIEKISNNVEVNLAINLYNERYGFFNSNEIITHEIESVEKHFVSFENNEIEFNQDESSKAFLLIFYKLILKNKNIYFVYLSVELIEYKWIENAEEDQVDNNGEDIFDYSEVMLIKPQTKFLLTNMERKTNNEKKSNIYDCYDFSDKYDIINKKYLLIYQEKENVLNNELEVSKKFGGFKAKINLSSESFDTEEGCLQDISNRLKKMHECLKNN